MPIAQVRVSIAGGSAVSGGVVALFGQTVALTATDTTGWSSARWEIYDYPPGFSIPAGWLLDGVTSAIYFAPTNPTTSPPTFTLPAAGLSPSQWGKFPIRLRINQNPFSRLPDGSPNTAYNPAFTDEATVIDVLSPNLGMPGISFNETTQFDTMRQWVGSVMSSLRKIDAGGPRAPIATAWWISFLTGSDTNTGTSVGAPLKTFAEFFRRLGPGYQILVPSLTINVIDHDQSDAISNQFICLGPTTVVTIKSASLAVASTGTLSAVTTKVTSTNTPPKVKDGTRAWTYGDRIRLTSGASTGAIAWIGKDEGAGVARTTDFALTVADPTTTLTPIVGNTYAIDTLVTVFISDITVNGIGISNQVDVPSTPGVQIVDMRVGCPTATGITTVNGNLGLVLVNSAIKGLAAGAFQVAYGSLLVAYNAYTIDTELTFLSSAFVSYLGGGHGTGSNLLADKRSSLRVADFIGQNYALTVAEGSEGVASAPVGNFDATASTLNPTGDGIVIGEGHNALDGYGATFSCTSTGVLWGIGNAGVGANVVANATLACLASLPCTITGTAGDFRVGRLATELSATSYSATTYVQGAVLTCTWAHLTAAFGAGGLGGSAVNPNKNCRVLSL